MELRHIHVAIALAEELHFGRAAQRLRIAQSAVSQSIKALEHELGASLFMRTKRSVRLTAAGRSFVDGARRALVDLAETRAAVQGIAAGEAGRLVVQYVPLAALTELPALVARFRDRTPAVELVIEAASSAEQLEAIRAGRCDIGFVPLAATRRELDPLAFEVISRDPLIAMMSSDHRLASRRWVRLEDLRGEAFVFLGQTGEPQLNLLFRNRCLEAGFDPDIRMEVASSDALFGFVAAGLGVSYVPEVIAKLRYPGVCTVPVRPVSYGGIAAVWHPAQISGAGRRFLDLLASAPSRRSPAARTPVTSSGVARRARRAAPRRAA